MGYEIRPIAEIEIPAFLRADGVAFGSVPSDEDLDPGAVLRADMLFGSELAPWCATPF
jgi:hypothetical protein